MRQTGRNKVAAAGEKMSVDLGEVQRELWRWWRCGGLGDDVLAQAMVAGEHAGLPLEYYGRRCSTSTASTSARHEGRQHLHDSAARTAAVATDVEPQRPALP